MNFAGQVRNSKTGADKGKTSQSPYKNTVCKHCGLKGHIQEGCFKLIGYPDWFKQSKDQRKEPFVNAVNILYDVNNCPANVIADDFKLFRGFMKNMKENGRSNLEFQEGKHSNIAFNFSMSLDHVNNFSVT